MPASEPRAVDPVSRSVYRAHLDKFGEPTRALTYDARTAAPGMSPALPQLMVCIWSADHGVDVTTMATIGMSARPLESAPHRLELHMSVRNLDPALEDELTRFLANVADYPWQARRDLDFWHRLTKPGPIPAFPSCTQLLFHPAFVDDGWHHVAVGGVEVRLLNVVPITDEEGRAAATSIEALIDLWDDREVDLFRDRSR